MYLVGYWKFSLTSSHIVESYYQLSWALCMHSYLEKDPLVPKESSYTCFMFSGKLTISEAASNRPSPLLSKLSQGMNTLHVVGLHWASIQQHAHHMGKPKCLVTYVPSSHHCSALVCRHSALKKYCLQYFFSVQNIARQSTSSHHVASNLTLRCLCHISIVIFFFKRRKLCQLKL